MKLSIQEKLCISRLFNKNGYVLDFSTTKFDDFTEECVGLRLTEHYSLSKGASLEKFLSDSDASIAVVLLENLLEYAKASDDFFEASNMNAAGKCNEIIAKYKKDAAIPTLSATFSSTYIAQMTQEMYAAVDKNPTDAIGKAKELIESCCKTILDNLGVAYQHNTDLSHLIDATVSQLKLAPKNIPDTAKEATTIKALLGNLRAIASNMATLRNAYGSGHGKTSSFTGLEPRHAKLAVGSSITLVSFLWDTYEKQAFQSSP